MSKAFPNTLLFLSWICWYCFPFLSFIQEISLSSHTSICLSRYLCRNISDSLYWALHFSATSFQELAACRITLKIIYFILQQSCILEPSLTIPVFSWYLNVTMMLFLSSSGVWFSCRAAVTALHFAAWMSSWCGCAQQNSPWNFWANISHVGTFNLQGTWVRSSLWSLFSMFLFFCCSYFKITVVLGVLFAWHMVLFCKVLAS